MKEQLPRHFVLKCPNNACPGLKPGGKALASSPGSGQFVRKGFYRRKSDSKRIPRFQCLACGRSVSSAAFFPTYRQKKRAINPLLYEYLGSGMSQRRAAKILGINRKTVVSRHLWLGAQAKARQDDSLQQSKENGHLFEELHFDEMESFERTKCLPLSIPMVVEEKTRIILGFRVCAMPANGPLATISLRRYGPREDQREQAASDLFEELKAFISPQARFLSDQKPAYPNWIKKHFPHATHRTVKGRDGCVTGQGELKKVGFDPMFSFNHTAAMLRANINRLFRRTWCTTKKAERLAAHIALYVDYHNTQLIKAAWPYAKSSEAPT